MSPLANRANVFAVSWRIMELEPSLKMIIETPNLSGVHRLWTNNVYIKRFDSWYTFHVLSNRIKIKSHPELLQPALVSSRVSCSIGLDLLALLATPHGPP